MWRKGKFFRTLGSHLKERRKNDGTRKPAIANRSSCTDPDRNYQRMLNS